MSILIDLINYLFDHSKDIGGFLAMLGAMYYFICRTMKKLQPYTNMSDNIGKINQNITDIKKELTHNSGTSLKDFVYQIKADVKSNTQLTTTILNRQRWMLDNRSEPIFETNQDGKFTWVNDSFIRLTDRGFKDLENNNWVNILHEDIRRDITDDWNSAIKAQRNFEHNIKIVDAKNYIYNAKLVAHRQQDGNYIGTLNNVIKIG